MVIDSLGSSQALDVVITNALIIDPALGVLKADIGIKNGRISAIGKAGNPDIQPGVTFAIGAATPSIVPAFLRRHRR